MLALLSLLACPEPTTVPEPVAPASTLRDTGGGEYAPASAATIITPQAPTLRDTGGGDGVPASPRSPAS